MLINTKPSIAIYDFTGIATLPIPFAFYEVKSISVGYRRTNNKDDLSPVIPLVPGADFIVEGSKADELDSTQAFTGGKVTLTADGLSKVSLGNAIVVQRHTAIEQQYAYNELDDFPAKSHENALGRLTVVAQELNEGLTRALQVPPGATASGDQVLNDIMISVGKAEDAADRAETAADKAEEAVELIKPENFVAVDNTKWAFDAVGLQPYGYRDKDKYLRISETGDGITYSDVEADPNAAMGKIRNVILAGRQKDGLPAFLTTHEKLDLYHIPYISKGKNGQVSVNNMDSSDYGPERPFANQEVYSGYYYQGQSSPVQTTQLFTYTFKRPTVLTGMLLVLHAMSQTPKVVQLRGKKFDDSEWTTIYSDENFKPYWNDREAEVADWAGTMTWFTDNTKEVDQIQIEFSHPTTYTQINTIRFWEAVYPGLDKYDVVLKGTSSEPFKASVAKGSAGDQVCVVKQDYVFPGNLLAEMSRNYIYLVPENPDGSCPDYVNKDKAVYLPESAAYMVRDLRKIHYCSEEQLKRQCVLALQGTEVVDRKISNEVYGTKLGGLEYPVSTSLIDIDTSSKPRGANSSFKLTSTASSWVQPTNGDHSYNWKGEAVSNLYPSQCTDFTLEIDLKYAGPAQAENETYNIIFDFGYYTNYNFALAYRHSLGQFIIYHGPTNNWQYAAPYVMDSGWHTVSLSKRKDKVFIHVDGKCLMALNGFSMVKQPYYYYWMVGRWIHSAGSGWPGSFNNVRYTIGDCLHQNEDYEIPSTFYTGTIPDKTLWWDHISGIVKERDAATDTWRDAPMLALGHVDTLFKEHIHSERKQGMYRTATSGLPRIKNVTANGQYDTNYVPKAIFNFGEGGSYPYLTVSGSANNTNLYWVLIEFEKPEEIEELRIVDPSPGAGVWSYPCIFNWKLSDDAVTWDTVIDRHLFVNDGNPSTGTAHHLGSHFVSGFKAWKYDAGKPYKYAMIEFPPKGAVPFYANKYTGARLMLVLKGAKPEIEEVQSYVIGTIFTAKPFIARIGNNEYTVKIPFGGQEFSTHGYIVECNDWTGKKRMLGQANGYYISDHIYYGEILYQGNDYVTIMTNSYCTSLYSGSGGDYNSRTAPSVSSSGDVYITCRRLY